MKDVTHMTFDEYYDTFEVEPVDPYEDLTFLGCTASGVEFWCDEEAGTYWRAEPCGLVRVEPEVVAV